MSHSRAVLLIALAQAACSSAGSGADGNAASGRGAAGTSGSSQASGASASSSTGATGSGASGTTAGTASATSATGAATGGTAGNASGSSTGGVAGSAAGGSAGTGAATGTGTGSAGGGSAGTMGASDAGSPCVVGCSPSDGGPASSDGSVSDGASGPSLPIIASLVANQAGRSGDDLLLSVQGSDVNRTAYAVDIQLGDKNGKPINAFRDWSGIPSTFERVVLFDGSSAVGQSSFTRSVTLAGFMKAFPSISRVAVAVVDTVGTSRSMTAGVTLQTVDNLHQRCDPAVIADRCAAGLACDATTSTCTNPAPPQITQMVYITSPQGQGARVLFAGSDPADDLSTLHLEFLDALGVPVRVDLTGNQDFQSTFDISVSGASKLGHFFYADQTAEGFDRTVTQLAATPTGSSSGTGSRVTAMLESPPVASTGGPCDLRGFASCAAGDSCVKDPTSGTSTCVPTAAALMQATASAPTLDPSTGRSFVTGYATSANLWGDPPSDCVPPGVHGLPEGIVLLHLATSVSSLTLTTSNQETNVQAAIFVLKGQGSSVETNSLGCSEGYPSAVTVNNLAAGDYTVVVGSATAAGGEFGLSIP